jgi:hypothetical protein
MGLTHGKGNKGTSPFIHENNGVDGSFHIPAMACPHEHFPFFISFFIIA